MNYYLPLVMVMFALVAAWRMNEHDAVWPIYSVAALALLALVALLILL